MPTRGWTLTEQGLPRLSVDIVSDIMCPWCIIGWLKFQKVMTHFAGRLAFRVQWHPFELNPDMPPEGEDAAAHVMRKYGITAEQSRANSSKMAEVAAGLGFAFNRGPGFQMRNSFDAHRLLTWAGALEEPGQTAATGVQTALKLALFTAHFTDNRDVSDHMVLADVAASVGLDRARAQSILASGEFGEMVRSEEAYWADRNITGVPAFILGGRMMIPGAQEPDVFVRVIENKVLAPAA
ncbi:MAG: DsbA family oxidoreductase [Sphingopyxis sp.]|nr:DsbA family oxidoreductase [Sphingopyxis sp.]